MTYDKAHLKLENKLIVPEYLENDREMRLAFESGFYHAQATLLLQAISHAVECLKDGDILSAKSFLEEQL